MSSDDDPEKLLGSSVPPLSPPPHHSVTGNPQIEPPVMLGNPKGSIGGVRYPIARLGLILALLAAVGVAVWWWAL